MNQAKRELQDRKEASPKVLGIALIIAGGVIGAVGYNSVLGVNQLIIDTVKAGAPNAGQLATNWLDLAFGLSACVATGATLLAVAGLLVLKREITWRVRVKPVSTGSTPA